MHLQNQTASARRSILPATPANLAMCCSSALIVRSFKVNFKVHNDTLYLSLMHILTRESVLQMLCCNSVSGDGVVGKVYSCMLYEEAFSAPDIRILHHLDSVAGPGTAPEWIMAFLLSYLRVDQILRSVDFSTQKLEDPVINRFITATSKTEFREKKSVLIHYRNRILTALRFLSRQG